MISDTVLFGRHMAKGSILKNLVPRKTGLKIMYLP